MTNAFTRQALVSVIIPTYNRAGIIGETVENILQQTYPQIEIIVVDDGSTDGTLARLHQYGSRIRVVHQANVGPAAARNRGIDVGRGEIIAFQDSDDLWDPSKIERQVRLLEKLGPGVPCCLCNMMLHFTDGRVTTSFRNAPISPVYEEGLWTNVAEVLTTRFVMFNQAVAIRRTVLERIGGFDIKLKYLEDYELPLRLALEGPWAFIRTPLAMWRQGSALSWSRKAFEESVLTQECEVALRQRILQSLPENGSNSQLQGLMKRQIRRANRELKNTRMIHGNSHAGRVLGSVCSKIERFRTALDRKLPGYPKMKVLPVPAPIAVEAGISHDGEAQRLGVATLG